MVELLEDVGLGRLWIALVVDLVRYDRVDERCCRQRLVRIDANTCRLTPVGRVVSICRRCAGGRF